MKRRLATPLATSWLLLGYFGYFMVGYFGSLP